jgi:hypothetical protein
LALPAFNLAKMLSAAGWWLSKLAGTGMESLLNAIGFNFPCSQAMHHHKAIMKIQLRIQTGFILSFLVAP